MDERTAITGRPVGRRRVRGALRRRANWEELVKFCIVGASGYVEGATTQVAEVSTGVRLLLGAVPVVLAALAFVCFRLYPLRGRDDDAVADADASPAAADPLPR